MLAYESAFVGAWQICLAGLDLAGCDSAAQECEIMLKLQHPNIVNYIGSNMDKASEVIVPVAILLLRYFAL